MNAHIKTAVQRTTVIGTLAADGWAVTFSTTRRGLDGAAARPVPSSLYQNKCNSSPINGLCTSYYSMRHYNYQSRPSSYSTSFKWNTDRFIQCILPCPAICWRGVIFGRQTQRWCAFCLASSLVGAGVARSFSPPTPHFSICILLTHLFVC